MIVIRNPINQRENQIRILIHVIYSLAAQSNFESGRVFSAAGVCIIILIGLNSSLIFFKNKN